MRADLVAEILDEALVSVPVGGDLRAQGRDPALAQLVEALEECDQDAPALGADLFLDGDVLDDGSRHSFSLLRATACNMLP